MYIWSSFCTRSFSATRSPTTQKRKRARKILWSQDTRRHTCHTSYDSYRTNGSSPRELSLSTITFIIHTYV